MSSNKRSGAGSHGARQNGNNIPLLRPQSEFFLGGVIPVGAQHDNCCICTDPLDTDVVQITRCRHCHHLTCIVTWWKSSAARRGSCPLCRVDLFVPDPPPAHAPSLRGTPFQARDQYTTLGAVRAYADTQDGQTRLRGFMDAVEAHALYAALGEEVPMRTGGPSFPMIGYGGDSEDREDRRTSLERHPLYQVYMNGQRARTARRMAAQARSYQQQEVEEHESNREADDEGTARQVARQTSSEASGVATGYPTGDIGPRNVWDDRAITAGFEDTESSSALTRASTPPDSPRANEHSNNNSPFPPDQATTEEEDNDLIDYSDDLLQDVFEQAEAERRDNNTPDDDPWDDPNARTAVRYGVLYRRDHNHNWCIREPTDEEEEEEEAAQRRSNENNQDMNEAAAQPAEGSSYYGHVFILNRYYPAPRRRYGGN